MSDTQRVVSQSPEPRAHDKSAWQYRRKIKWFKGPSQPPPFSMPSKLLILHGEVKSECFTIRCVPESTFNYF